MRSATRGSYSVWRVASRCRCQAQASGGEKLAGDVGQHGQGDLFDLRAGGAQRTRAFARKRARRSRRARRASRWWARPAGGQKRACPRARPGDAASTSCSSTASRTERVIAQAVSSVVESGIAPSVGVRRAVFLKPTKPCSAAGMRIDPPVSEPSAAQAAPVATETAPPEVEPPGMRGSASSLAVTGFAGVPKCGLMPTAENANSDMLVRPMKAAPAARRRATAGQSATAGGSVASTVEPAAVTSPCTLNRSFTLTARPAKRATGAPAARRASTARAVSAAASNEVLTNVCRFASDRADATQASSSATAGERSRPRRSNRGSSGCYNRLAWPGTQRSAVPPSKSRTGSPRLKGVACGKNIPMRFEPDSRTNLWSPT